MQRRAGPTLSDYPLLPISYDGLGTLVEATLPHTSESTTPCLRLKTFIRCTAVQEGILISQLRNPSAYIFHAVCSVRHTNSDKRVDPDGIVRAWRRVVDRHPVLRTVFIESVHREAFFYQAVLKEADCKAHWLRSSDEQDAAQSSTK